MRQHVRTRLSEVFAAICGGLQKSCCKRRPSRHSTEEGAQGAKKKSGPFSGFWGMSLIQPATEWRKEMAHGAGSRRCVRDAPYASGTL